jgi:ribose transport system ATP-binding protein
VERVYPPPPEKSSEQAGVICELENFGSPPRLHNVSMTIGRGEIVGIGGLQGQGQSDLFLALFGVRRASGSLVVDGKRLRLRNPAQAIHAGIALVPEDRASEGLCLSLAIRDNIALGNLENVSRLGFIAPRLEDRLVGTAIKSLQIKLRNPRQEAASLSGGNQQKVLLGRVLARHPSLLLMYDATRGVDVGTKTEIYRLMREQCEQGVGILFYSTDASELANMADRVLVLHDGMVRADLRGAELTEANIIAHAVGGRAEAVAG